MCGRHTISPAGEILAGEQTVTVGGGMDAATRAVLNETEKLLIAETSRETLAALDEEAAIELLTRIRRARDKYVRQYRRAASARVAERGGRGAARPENARAALKAEAFERALSQVSRRLAVLARESAAALRAERLALARAAKQRDWPGASELAPASTVTGPSPRRGAPGTALCATQPANGDAPERSPQARASRPDATASAPRVRPCPADLVACCASAVGASRRCRRRH
jgi:hypothetical protein